MNKRVRSILSVMALGLAAGFFHSAEAASDKGTFQQLLKAGKPVECTINRADENGKMNGTAFIAGNRVRGTFTLTSKKGSSWQAQMLKEGDWLYNWGGPMGEKQGTKMRIDPSKKKTSSNKQGLSLEDEVDVDCKPWKESASLFAVPQDVTFQDITSMQKQAYGQQPPAAQSGVSCSACDAAPAGPAKDQCLQALGCR